jgi:hypothetical protein
MAHPELYIPHALPSPPRRATSHQIRVRPIASIRRPANRQRCVFFFAKTALRSFIIPFRVPGGPSVTAMPSVFSFTKPSTFQNIPIPRRRNSDFCGHFAFTRPLSLCKEAPHHPAAPARPYPLPPPLSRCVAPCRHPHPLPPPHRGHASPPHRPSSPLRRPAVHLLRLISSPVPVLFLLGFVRRRRRTGRQLMLPRRHEGKWGFRQQSPPYACPPSALPLLEMQEGAFARTVVGRERPRASGGHAWLRPRSKASAAQRQ